MPQSYENHIRHDKVAYAYIFMLLISLIIACVALFVDKPSLIVVALILNTIASILLSANARVYGTKVQDRIIRTEMKLRLREILPADQTARIQDFTISQLVALRFASDAELPGLAVKVLEGNITSGKQIKQMVTDWQADTHRV